MTLSALARTLPHRFLYQTVVERLLCVGLFGFGMIEKLERIHHGTLRGPERDGIDFPIVFKTTLQERFIVDFSKSLQRPLGRRCTFLDRKSVV